MKKSTFLKGVIFLSLDLLTSADNLSGCVITHFKALLKTSNDAWLDALRVRQKARVPNSKNFCVSDCMFRAIQIARLEISSR